MKAIAVLPLPCDARLLSKVVTAASKNWESEHPGQVMTMDHLETRNTEFGKAVVIWDKPRPQEETHA